MPLVADFTPRNRGWGWPPRCRCRRLRGPHQRGLSTTDRWSVRAGGRAGGAGLEEGARVAPVRCRPTSSRALRDRVLRLLPQQHHLLAKQTSVKQSAGAKSRAGRAGSSKSGIDEGKETWTLPLREIPVCEWTWTHVCMRKTLCHEGPGQLQCSFLGEGVEPWRVARLVGSVGTRTARNCIEVPEAVSRAGAVCSEMQPLAKGAA